MFQKISIHTPRQFVPADLNAGSWPTLEPLFDQLRTKQQIGYTVPPAGGSNP